MDDHPTQLSAYGSILLLGIVGILLVCVTIYLAKILSPHKPNSIKLSTYECGEETTGSSWVQFNPRFYVIALVFLLFDVELIFVFPWSTVYAHLGLIQADSRWAWFAMAEMAIFIGILILGLLYVWKRGDLNWIKPSHSIPRIQTAIPEHAYDNLNSKVYQVKDYKSTDTQDDVQDQKEVKVTTGFKPRFNKPKA